MPGHTEDGISGSVERVRETVRTKGWDVVSRGDPRGLRHGDTEFGLSISYTVGLQVRYRHPEIVILGAPKPSAELLIGEAVARIATGTWSIDPGLLPDLDKRHRAWACAVRPQAFRDYLPFAARIYPKDEQAVQVILPDAKGRLPWDAGFSGPAAPMLAVLH